MKIRKDHEEPTNVKKKEATKQKPLRSGWGKAQEGTDINV